MDDGCKMFGLDSEVCFYNSDYRKDCPCKICLIKMMCVKTCPDFRIYIKKIDNLQEELLLNSKQGGKPCYLKKKESKLL